MQCRPIFPFVWLTLLVGVAPAVLPGQTPGAAAPLVEVKDKGFAVTLPVSAAGKKGSSARPLQASDLTLMDEGKAQTITTLSRDPQLPFQVGILVQTTRTVSPALEEERKGAGVLVDDLLGSGSGNEAFLLHFDRQVELLQEFTGSRERLKRELEEMGASSPRPNGRQQGPERTGDEREGLPRGNANRLGTPSQLYDAIYLAATELMSAKQGRKALVVFSDGVDSGSKVSLNDAVDAADRAKLSVYTIYFKGEQERSLISNFPSMGNGGNSRGGYPGGSRGGGYPGSGGGGYPGSQRRGEEPKLAVDGKKTLEKIAQRTGGRLFEAKKRENLTEIHHQIVEELRGLYWLTYTPEPEDHEGGFHKVTLKSNNGAYELSTREGYYAAGGSGAR